MRHPDPNNPGASVIRMGGSERADRTQFQPATPPGRDQPSGAHSGTKALPLMKEPLKEIHLPAEVPDAWGEGLAEVLDRVIHASAARVTSGLSPAALAEAYLDWVVHLAFSPGKQLKLTVKAARKLGRIGEQALKETMTPGKAEPCIAPLPQDRRFSAPEWREYPYSLIYQSFLLQQEWWHNATMGLEGVSKQHENMVEFTARQFLDVASPSNIPLLNPVVMRRTLEQGGQNLVRGAQNLVEDWMRLTHNKPPVGAETYQVGQNVAVTPGRVVYRNDLIELIQYEPTTDEVRPEPVLIVPAWIMKYYILDLSPENSLVRYLVSRGFTVFMISWKNPTREDRDRGMEDYRRLGVLSALDAINAIVPDRKVHAAGYCLGGTLLTIAAAAMAREGDDRLKSVTLFAAQADFREAGELTLFITETQVHFLEDMMWQQGYLDTKQMSGAFQLLRSNDLIWSYLFHNYLMGEREPMTDLMAWNADATRMPYRMHSEYLRQLFLQNDLAEGRFKVEGRPIALGDIRTPMFAVGTERDHVAPWRSVFKIHNLTNTDVTFLLTTGGHNAGIVSEPGRPHRSYRVLTKTERERHLDPETWQRLAQVQEGSWWPEWASWLTSHSGEPVNLPSLGAPPVYPVLDQAPGSYVREP
ncbi:PHA/PHB synthase family protein [Microvirga sesbaniae]|uniref:PHA/PHB synthase family protein n=1 Tax=Microvirga sesbaniae TaxID=681392 RepID=UPI0021CA04C5|nr:alpha/beta fold hydrolase [Microvirga sp. HBU67692]